MISDVITQPVLPYEVVENILLYVDGVTFARAASVCKEWKRIVERLVKHRDKWKLCCENEIDKRSLNELVDKYYDEDCNTMNKYNTIYKNWVIWKILNDEQCTLTVQLLATAYDTDKSFTYIKVHNNVLFVSTADGNLVIFKDKERIQTIYLPSPGPVSKFSICSLLKYETKDDLDEFYDLGESNSLCNSFVLLVLQRNKLYYVCCEYKCENSGQCSVGEMYVEENVDDIKTFRNLVVIKRSKKIFILKFIEVSADFSENEYPRRKFKAQAIALGCTSKNYSVQDFNFSDEKYIKMTPEDGTILKMNTSKNMNYVPITVDCKLEYEYMTINKIFMPRSNFILSLSTDGTLILTIGKSSEYLPYMSVFRSRPSSVLLYVNVLLIGLESGELFIYNINNINTFDIRMPDKRICVSTTPIICLEVYHDQMNYPKIIATTENYLYLICKSLI